MRATIRVACLLLGLLSPVAAETSDTVGKGAWRALVLPKAKWVLVDTVVTEKPQRKIVVETYDVRKVAGAEVARLRWTFVVGKEKEDLGMSGNFPTQVAVTKAGIYLLDAKQDDTQIAARLKGKPSRSDPPKPYESTKRNEGRYLTFRTTRGGTVTCMGKEPLPGAGDCDDTCDAELCVSPTAGVVSIDGMWAPGFSIFVQPGFEILAPYEEE